MCYTQHRGTITYNRETDASPFLLEQIQDDNQAIKFCTGFPMFSHLIACFNFLGPAVSNLCYGTPKNDTPSVGGRHCCLSPFNEFFDYAQVEIVIKRARFGLPFSNKPTYGVKDCKPLCISSLKRYRYGHLEKQLINICQLVLGTCILLQDM